MNAHRNERVVVGEEAAAAAAEEIEAVTRYANDNTCCAISARKFLMNFLLTAIEGSVRLMLLLFSVW